VSITQYDARTRRWAIALVGLRLGSDQMYGVGQTETSARWCGRSGPPPIADLVRPHVLVRFVPIGDIACLT
jgi:hypothetical protein